MTARDCSRYVTVHSYSARRLFVKNCGFDASGDDSGIITYPNSIPSNSSSAMDNRNSNDNSNCVWNILAPPGTYITLHVTAFSLEPTKDRLFVLQPRSCLPFPSSATAFYYSGQQLAPGTLIPLYSNSAALYFYAGSPAGFDKRFRIAWFASAPPLPLAPNCRRAVDALLPPSVGGFVKNCGFDVSPQEAGRRIIKTPSLPSLTSNTFCVWNIEAGPPGTQLALNFTYFATEELYDRLFIFRPRDCRLVGQLSGVWPGSTASRLLTENAAALYFVADGSLTLKGFRLNWTFVTPPPPQSADEIARLLPDEDAAVGCANVVNSFVQLNAAADGSSHGGGGKFVKNCGLDVGSMLAGSTIRSLGLHEGVNYGNSNNKDNNNKFCVWNVVAPSRATVSLTILTFNLNQTAGDRLFILRPDTCGYAAGVGGYLTGDLSPGKVIVTAETAVSLYLYSPISYLIDYSADRGISLLASFTPREKPTGRENKGRAVRPNPLANITKTTGCCMAAIRKYLPRGKADDFDQNCGAHSTISKRSGAIFSPNHPHSYGNNHRCAWHVHVPDALRIRVIVEVEDKETYWDRLFVLRSGCRPLLEDGEIFVEDDGGVYVIDGDAFAVYFYTDETITARGFRIFWHAL